MKTLVAIAALCLPAGAQTVAIPGMPVTIPARAVPAQTFTIDVPKGGGKMSITVPSQILPPQTSSTAPRTAPVSLGTITINFTCAGPDMQHLACQAAQQVAQASGMPLCGPSYIYASYDCPSYDPETKEWISQKESAMRRWAKDHKPSVKQEQVQQWGDWPPDQHVSKPGDALVRNCNDASSEGFCAFRKPNRAAVPDGDGIQDIGTLGTADCNHPGEDEGCETHRRAAIHEEVKKEQAQQ